MYFDKFDFEILGFCARKAVKSVFSCFPRPAAVILKLLQEIKIEETLVAHFARQVSFRGPQ